MKVRRQDEEEAPRLFDRFAVALFSGVTAFLTGLAIWFVFVGFNYMGTFVFVIPFSIIWWFTGVMALLGFLLLDNLIAEIFGKVWKIISYAFMVEQ